MEANAAKEDLRIPPQPRLGSGASVNTNRASVSGRVGAARSPKSRCTCKSRSGPRILIPPTPPRAVRPLVSGTTTTIWWTMTVASSWESKPAPAPDESGDGRGTRHAYTLCAAARREPASIAADATYGNGEFLRWFLDRGITPYMRTRDSALRKNDPATARSRYLCRRATATVVRQASDLNYAA